MQLPNQLEISPTNLLDLDERVACQHFLGKSLDEALMMFRQNDVLYTEDLLFMGERAFNFYVDAYIEYVKTESRELIDIYVAMGIVISRGDASTDKKPLLRLVNAIAAFGLPSNSKERKLIRDYHEAASRIIGFNHEIPSEKTL